MGKHLNQSFFRKIKNFFWDCVSFNTPKAIVFNLSFIFFILIITPSKYLIYSPAKCVFKNVILPFIFRGNCPTRGLFANCECPACGLTRGMSELLRGNISSAIDYNFLVIPLFFVMVFVLVFNIVKWVRE